jgi:hypothetical protein
MIDAVHAAGLRALGARLGLPFPDPNPAMAPSGAAVDAGG